MQRIKLKNNLCKVKSSLFRLSLQRGFYFT